MCSVHTEQLYNCRMHTFIISIIVTKSRVRIHSTTTPTLEVVWAIVYKRFATSFAEAMSLPSYIHTRHEEDSEVTISINLDKRYLHVLVL